MQISQHSLYNFKKEKKSYICQKYCYSEPVLWQDGPCGVLGLMSFCIMCFYRMVKNIFVQLNFSYGFDTFPCFSTGNCWVHLKQTVYCHFKSGLVHLLCYSFSENCSCFREDTGNCAVTGLFSLFPAVLGRSLSLDELQSKILPDLTMAMALFSTFTILT